MHYILTKKEAVKLHRHMWNWIADKTEKRGKFINQMDYFEAMDIPPEERPSVNSYCCEYDNQKNGEDTDCCKYCPINWNSECDEGMCCDKKNPYDRRGLFLRWSDTNSIKERVKLARKIANLKEREM